MNITPEGLLAAGIVILFMGIILWATYEDPDDPRFFDTYF
jgi:hypothetical protein